jgi:hypothetical protein
LRPNYKLPLQLMRTLGANWKMHRSKYEASSQPLYVLLGFQRLDQPIDPFKGQLIGDAPTKLAIVSDSVIYGFALTAHRALASASGGSVKRSQSPTNAKDRSMMPDNSR